jgi:hypothetical protein
MMPWKEILHANNGIKVIVRGGWEDAGKEGTRLADPIMCFGQYWTPVLWYGNDEPSFAKTASLHCLAPKSMLRESEIGGPRE